MALKTFVKVGSINNLSDARYCAGMEADVLGFCLSPDHPGYLSPEAFKEITDWVAGVALAGEFYNQDAPFIKEQLKHYSLDWVEVNSLEVAAQLKDIAPKLLVRMNLLAWNEWKKSENDNQRPELILLEDEALTDALTFVENGDFPVPVLIGSGLKAEEMGALVATGKIKGIALRGGEEIRPGLRDFDDLADVLEALEIEN
jgi:phosphoribosylanthranilate isomerase